MLITVLALVIFLPGLKNNFVSWDDNVYLQENTSILDASWYSVKKIFSSFYIGNYQPLTVLTFLTEYHFFRFNPFFYHLDNIILHLAVVLLVFWLFFILSRRVSIAAMVSLLFAVHPLRVESVVWVSGRKDMLYSIFFLGAFIAYIKWRERQPAPRLYWLSVALFLGAILCKAMSMTLPAVLLLVDFFMARKFDKRTILDKIPYLILAAVFSYVAVTGAYAGGAVRQASLNNSLFDKAATFSYCLTFYLNKIFLPLGLSCLYPLPGNTAYAVSIVGVLLLALGLALSARLSRKIVFGSLLFLITALPILQFVPIGQTLFADRYTYLPCLGVFYLLAEGLLWLWENKLKASRIKSAVALSCGLVLVVSLSVMTWQRSKVWKDGITLWSDVIKNYPQLALPYNNRGAEYLIQKQYKKAYDDLLLSIKIDPLYVEAYANLAALYENTGDNITAIKFLDRAIAFDPSYVLAYDATVKFYSEFGHNDKALAAAVKQLKVRPDYAQGYANLGAVLGNMGYEDRAIKAFHYALKLDPNLGAAYANLSLSYFKKKQYRLAWEYLVKAERLNYPVCSIFADQVREKAGKL